MRGFIKFEPTEDLILYAILAELDVTMKEYDAAKRKYSDD